MRPALACIALLITATVGAARLHEPRSNGAGYPATPWSGGCLVVARRHMHPATPCVSSFQADVKQELKANYAKMSAAIMHKDVAGWVKYLARDYVSHEMSGQTITRFQLLTAMRSQVSFTIIREWSRTITGLVVGVDQATAEVHAKNRITLTSGVKGASHQIDANIVQSDVWVKSGSDWLLQATRVRKRTVLQDGKPVRRPRRS